MSNRSKWKQRIYHYGLGVGLPISVVRGVADRLDVISNSKMVQERRRVASELLTRVKPPLRILPESAYVMISRNEFPEIPELISLGKEIVEQRRNELPPLGEQATFWGLIKPGDLTGRYRPLLEFALSDRMLAIICDHLGMVPRLRHCDVWLSPPMPTLVGSHRYHLDKPDGEIVAVFININDVGPKQGPFTFLPADISKAVCRKTRYDLVYYRGGRRLDDADVESATTPVKLEGPSGTGAIVNTSRCLHLGSRCSEPRIVLSIKYVLPHKFPPSHPEMFAGHPYGDDPLRRLLLEG